MVKNKTGVVQKKLWAALLIAVFSLLIVQSAWAQTGGGNNLIFGTAYDDLGAPLPGVGVTATDDAGVSCTASTQNNGAYSIDLSTCGVFATAAYIVQFTAPNGAVSTFVVPSGGEEINVEFVDGSMRAIHTDPGSNAAGSLTIGDTEGDAPEGAALALPDAELPDGEMELAPESEAPEGAAMALPDAELPDGEVELAPESEAPEGEALALPDGELPADDMSEDEAQIFPATPEELQVSPENPEGAVPTAVSILDGNQLPVALIFSTLALISLATLAGVFLFQRRKLA